MVEHFQTFRFLYSSFPTLPEVSQLVQYMHVPKLALKNVYRETVPQISNTETPYFAEC